MAASGNRPFLTETSFRVRFAETDMMGIVHHAAYIVYLEEGRSGLGREQGIPYAELERMGFSLAVSDIHIRYYEPARYDDLISVLSWIEQVRSRGMTFGYEIVNTETGQRLVTARTKHICVDHNGTVCRLPHDWIAPLTSQPQAG
ncbi:MAG: acyl-CoA thioesterase [Anaerolineae bacterium]|nr:acyl-CoA thioesterase [Anaerolineae bacterium]